MTVSLVPLKTAMDALALKDHLGICLYAPALPLITSDEDLTAMATLARTRTCATSSGVKAKIRENNKNVIHNTQFVNFINTCLREISDPALTMAGETALSSEMTPS